MIDSDKGVLSFGRVYKKERYSKELSGDKYPCLLIKTNGICLEKQDTTLIVGKISIDISRVTIGKLCNILEDNGVSCSVIEDTNLLSLPALLLRDMRTKATFQEPVKQNPVDLEEYSFDKSSNIISINLKTNVELCTDLQGNRVVIEQKNNKVFIKNFIDKNYMLVYSTQSEEFIWNISTTHLITNSKEFVSKSIDYED